MELIPSERTVLTRSETCFYRAGYVGLAKKGFITRSPDEQSFRITNMGMKVMAGTAR